MTHMIKVLNFSTHNEDCGIGKYQEGFVRALDGSSEVKSSFFAVSPNVLRVMSSQEKEKVFSDLREQLAAYDILHIQHEFSFLHSPDFVTLAEIAKRENKQLIITIHSSPTLAYEPPRRHGYGPRSIVRYAKQVRRKLIFDKVFTGAVRIADAIIVHNTATKKALMELGVEEQRIRSIILPVPNLDHTPKSTLIGEKLHRQDGDIILSAVGFLHRYKLLDHAVKALTYLPDHYKLAIIGGMHMDHDTTLYNDIADLIRKLGLRDRVYITGFVEDDVELNALIRETDMCIYPYDKHYYSNISSASLNNAFANYKPVVAYPTDSFIELNQKVDAMVLTRAFAYYELAREVERLDITAAAKKSKTFADTYGYDTVTKDLTDIYKSLVG